MATVKRSFLPLLLERQQFQTARGRCEWPSRCECRVVNTHQIWAENTTCNLCACCMLHSHPGRRVMARALPRACHRAWCEDNDPTGLQNSMEFSEQRERGHRACTTGEEMGAQSGHHTCWAQPARGGRARPAAVPSAPYFEQRYLRLLHSKVQRKSH